LFHISYTIALVISYFMKSAHKYEAKNSPEDPIFITSEKVD